MTSFVPALVALALLLTSAALIFGVPVNTNTFSVIQQDGGGQNCVILNGILHENGASRALTAAEREKLNHYNEAWQQWFEKKMDGTFNEKGFPFNNDSDNDEAEDSAKNSSSSSSSAAEEPQFPCICSECAQPSSQKSN